MNSSHSGFSVWCKIEKPEVSLEEIISEQRTALIVEKKESRKENESENTKKSLKGDKDKDFQHKNPEDIQSVWEDIIDQESVAINFESASTHATQFDQENKDYNCLLCVSETDNIDLSNDTDDESPEDLQLNANWDWFEFVEENLGLMPSIYRYNGKSTSKQSEEVNTKCTILPRYSNKSFQKSKYNRTSCIKTAAILQFDNKTTQLLNKMIENSILDGFDYSLHIGKDTKVLLAYVSPICNYIQGHRRCVIKVFHGASLEFEQLDTIKSQIKKRMGYNGAEREMLILCRLRRAGILCPEVLMLKDNVLVTSLVGFQSLNHPSFNLKDTYTAYSQVMTVMKTVYQEARLVHGRLRPKHILWLDGQCYIIGWKKALDVSHKRASYLLYRDCRNIIKFFKSRLDNVTTPDKLYESIVGPIYETSKQISKKPLAKHNQIVMDRFEMKTTKKFDNLSKLLLGDT